MKKVFRYIIITSLGLLFIVSTMGIHAVWHSCSMSGKTTLNLFVSNNCCSIKTPVAESNNCTTSLSKEKCCRNVNLYFKISNEYRTSEFIKILINKVVISELKNIILVIPINQDNSVEITDTSPPPIIYKKSIIYSIHQLKICEDPSSIF